MNTFGFDLTSYLSDLEFLVNIDSGSYDCEGVRKVSAFFAAEFAKLGWSSREVHVHDDLAPCLEVFSPGCGETIDYLLLAHADTVFPKGTVAERPFTTKDGRAYGPGVMDMKSGALYALYLARAYHAAGQVPPSICVAVNSHEEIGSRHARSWIEGLARRSRRALILEPARANGDLVIARKGSCRYTFTFSGKAAHSGVDPQNGASAINELAHWAVELHKLTDFDQGMNLNVGLIEGGTSVNAVADTARAELDVRVSTQEQAYAVQRRIDQLRASPFTAGVTVDVSGGMTRPPMPASKSNRELASIFDEAAAGLGIKIAWQHTGGGSDGNFTAALGVPTVDGVGPVGGAAHSKEEYLEIASISERFALLMAVVGKSNQN